MTDKTFLEKVEEYNEGEREENPMENVSKFKIGAILGGMILVNLIGWPLLLNGQAGMAMLVLVFGLGTLTISTKTGREFIKQMFENIDSQQQQSSSKNKQVCQSCGWRNPEANEYCHDCGEMMD